MRKYWKKKRKAALFSGFPYNGPPVAADLRRSPYDFRFYYTHYICIVQKRKYAGAEKHPDPVAEKIRGAARLYRSGNIKDAENYDRREAITVNDYI